MAYAIAREKISSEVASTIRKMLTIMPKTSGFNKYSQGAVIEPIVFYKLEDGIVHIPYLFAASLFQIIPNDDISYPKLEWKFTGQLRDKQVEVEATSWKQLSAYGTSTLGLYPGFGKTILGAKLASRTQLLTVVLVHREPLVKQWKATFEEFTDAKVWCVGEKNPPSTCDVIVCMDTRWSLIKTELRDRVGFLIIDEAHAFCTPSHVQCLLSFHPKYILAESATLERDDGMESMMYAICGTHGVYREFEGNFSVIKVNTGFKPARKQNSRQGTDWSALVNESLFCENRNKLIVEFVKTNLSRTILILTSVVKHAELLNSMLVEAGISSDFLCGSKKGYNDGKVLVGTISKIGTGFDQRTFCDNYSGNRFDLLLLVCSIKKYSVLVQNAGRVFRSENPTIIYFVDDDSIFDSHWRICKKWFVTRGGNVTECSFKLQ